MGTFDGIFGTLLFGTWFASFLSGLVAAEAYTYFTTFSNDSWSRKGLVGLSLIICVAALVGDYANAYLPTVTYWGNVEAIVKVYWPLPLYSIMNMLLAFIVESFLIHRFYTLSKNIWATIFLYALVLLGVAGYLMGFIPLVRGSSYADGIPDVLTAAGLIWKLHSMKTNFKDTRTFMNRVIVGSIHTGTATSLCSILLLVTFLNNPQSNVATFFVYQFAPLYALTLLFNFNLRRHGANGGTTKASESRGGGHSNILMDGIRVQHSAIVTMDPTDSELEAARRRTEDGSIKKELDTDAYGARRVAFNGN